ncbi:hypothetical protein [Brevundimonas diminuta]|uniref:hypothetical protein n=1 Tax=Brevundimonas diminuta TaxID=293 RepID=UPI003F81CFBC
MNDIISDLVFKADDGEPSPRTPLSEVKWRAPATPFEKFCAERLAWIGVDYGAKASIAVTYERNADGSITVLDEVVGRGTVEIGGAPIRTRT